MRQKRIRDVVREVDGLAGGLMALEGLPTVRQLEELGGAARRLAALLDQAGTVRVAEACRAAAKLATDCEQLAKALREPDPDGSADVVVTKEEFDEFLQAFRTAARRALRSA